MSLPLNDKDTKVTPAVLQAITMMEVAERLADIMDLMHREEPAGNLQSITVPVTDIPVEVNLGTWIKATLYSDRGLTPPNSDVYIYNERQQATTLDAPLRESESLVVDHRRQTTVRFYLVCAAGGSASIRIFYQ